MNRAGAFPGRFREGLPRIAARRVQIAGLVMLVLGVVGLAVASPAGAVVVSLGDSYSSGEGAGPFDAGTGEGANKCHRSVNAWPRLSGVPKRAHLACSGAKTRDFYYGQKKVAPDNVGQLERLRAIAKREKITRVLVGVGGNDLGFGAIMRDCFVKDCLKRMDAVELPRLRGVVRSDVARVLRAAHRESGNAEVILVGYPNAIPAADKPFTSCGWLTDQEKGRVWRLQDELDRVLRVAAEDGGAYYVSIARALEGHELCTPDSWMRPIGTARVLPVQQQGHPNRNGQYAINRAVRAGLEAQRIYFTTHGDVQSLAPRSATRQRVTTVAPGTQYTTAIAAAGSRLYWITHDGYPAVNGSIFTLSPPTTGPIAIASGITEGTDALVVRDRVWWLEEGGLSSAAFDGSDVRRRTIALPNQIYHGAVHAPGLSMATDGRYIYVNRSLENMITRIDLDTGSITWRFIRLPAENGYFGLAVAGGYLYFSDQYANLMGRARLDGTHVELKWLQFKKGIGGPGSIAADSQYIYFITYPTDDAYPGAQGRIGRVFRDGTGLTYSFIPTVADGALALTP